MGVAKLARIPLSFALIGGHGHCVASVFWKIVANKWLEVRMPVSRKDVRGGRAYAFPLLGIATLLVSYWILSDWHQMPSIIDAALSVVHFGI